MRPLFALLLLLLAACDSQPEPPLALDVWYGEAQRVGHLGGGQADYNLLGETTARRLEYELNGGRSVRLTVSHEPFGFRRLGGPGHFNADIPLTALRPGLNEVLLRARHRDGSTLERRIALERVEGRTPLPLTLDWANIQRPNDVGHCVDGLWTIADGRLQSAFPAYDRLFVIGDETWTDYEVQTTVIVDAVAQETGPYSGGNGLGIVFRFCGHIVGGPLKFPEAQPKWGYLPFGAITWLRWKKGSPALAPSLQFYRGDRNELHDHGPYPFVAGEEFHVRASCRTEPPAADGTPRTRYRFKVWPMDAPEPAADGFDVVQESREALRSGGFALVAHHVSVRFGQVTVSP